MIDESTEGGGGAAEPRLRLLDAVRADVEPWPDADVANCIPTILAW